ncbi:kinase-like protein [Armillaria gallica]|uniref:non-specific serine/threonine protein kinase n=1 Tax=Armillaria gallica TaxID=47427 RepID=A0A2H3EA66_ARMGA|nr:kinase-like protein [Armillaria gallica]
MYAASATSAFYLWLEEANKNIRTDPDKVLRSFENGRQMLNSAVEEQIQISPSPALIAGGNHPFRPTLNLLSDQNSSRRFVEAMGSQFDEASLPNGLAAFQISLYRYALRACVGHYWKDNCVSLESGLSLPISEPIHKGEEWDQVANLGRGGSGLVRVYRKKGEDRCIMVKGIITRHGIEQAEKERSILAQLDHIHIVRFLGSYFDRLECDFWIHMDYISGGTLAGLSVSVQLLEADVKVLIRQVLNGLIFLHCQTIVHGNIKGSNLFITLEGCVKIGDLGCATVIDPARVLSRSSSPCFMSPEVLFSDNYDEKTDIWSLGMVIVELLKQGHPWARNIPGRVILMVHERDQHLPALLQGITSELVRSILGKIFMDQGARPSALQLANDEWFSTA